MDTTSGTRSNPSRPAGVRAGLDLARWAFYARYRELAGYPGWFLLDIFIPILITIIPLLLSRAAGGGVIAGLGPASNSAAFLLIGANVFLLTLRAFWDIGLWLENEQRSGTLEMLFLAPCDRRWIIAGIALFNLARGLLNFCLSFALGCILFGIDPFQGSLPLALLFMAAGTVPLYALALLFGALVLRFKESDALVQIAQSLLALLVGVYYPIGILPPLLRGAALLLPPAWITHDMRAALLDTGYILQAWPRDLAVLAGMCLLLPPLANALLRRTETALRRNGGLRES